MNVLDIPKQVGRELGYTKHAKQRAYERGVPTPKYLPLNCTCHKVKEVDDRRYFTIDYYFNDNKYCMVLAEDEYVITVYPLDTLDTEKYELEAQLEIFANINRRKQKEYERKLAKQRFNESKFKHTYSYDLDDLTMIGDVICLHRERTRYHKMFA